MHLRLDMQLIFTSAQSMLMNTGQSKMIAAKTRVAPSNNQNIPRLELLGALILSRLMETVKRALQQFTTIFITNSLVVLTWVKTADKKYKKFIENRVAQIRQN